MRRRQTPSSSAQLLRLEDARPDEEADARQRLEREARASSGHDVERQLGVLPVVELRGSHVERATVDDAQEHVPLADPELALGEAHQGRCRRSSPALVEEERPVRPSRRSVAMSARAASVTEHALDGHVGSFSSKNPIAFGDRS